jgi:hypothetical protein
VQPGDSPLTLTSVGNGSLSLASTFRAQINGTTQGTDYSALQVTGTFDLGGATLDAVFGNNFVPAVGGPMFTILHASGGLSANQFDQGATAILNGWNFAIQYGTNDVVLQRIKADTTTTVTPPSSAAFTTLKATVTPANGATALPDSPIGNVTFFDGTTPLDTRPLVSVNGVQTATLDLTLLPTDDLHAGFHNITAVYDGSDPEFNGSTSSAVTVGGLAVIGLAPTGPVAELSSVTVTFNTGVQSFPLTAVTLTGPFGRPVALADAGGNPLPGVKLVHAG